MLEVRSVGTERRLSTVLRSVSVVFALIAGFIMMGVIDLLTLPGWVNQDFEWEVPLEASWCALFTFFLAGGYGWMALFPRTPWPALAQLAICALALLVSAAAGQDVRPLMVAAGIVVSGLVLWVLSGRPSIGLVGELSMRWGSLAVAVLGLPLWLPYASEAFSESRSGILGSVTQGIEHWPVQGAVGLALVLGSLTLALWGPGRPLLRVTLSLSSVWIGMAELAYPDRAGAMGSLRWGIAVTLWGLAVALVALPPQRTGSTEAITRTGTSDGGEATPAGGQLSLEQPDV